MARRSGMALSSIYGPQDARPTTVVAGGVAGIAAASTAPGGSYAGVGEWTDTNDPKVWIVGINLACIAWIFWLRFVYRGAAL